MAGVKKNPRGGSQRLITDDCWPMLNPASRWICDTHGVFWPHDEELNYAPVETK